MPRPINYDQPRFVLHTGGIDVDNITADPFTPDRHRRQRRTRRRDARRLTRHLPDATITEVPGALAELFPLEGEGHRYFESLNHTAVYPGQLRLDRRTPILHPHTP